MDNDQNLFDIPLKIAVVGRSQLFEPYREALVRVINEIGFEAEGFEYINYDYKPDCFLIINPLMYNNEKLNTKDHIFAAIQTEQICTENVYCLDQGYKNLYRIMRTVPRYDMVFEWSKDSYCYLAEIFKHVYYFPHSYFDELSSSEIIEEDKYDLLFTGWPKGIDRRRERILDSLHGKYSFYPKYDNVWGSEKFKAMQESRICLNIHFDHGMVFESPRIYESLANKKFVLSEKIYDSTPFTAGEDYIDFHLNDLERKIDFYLSHEEERYRIAENGFNKVRNDRLEDNIWIIIDKVIQHKNIRQYRDRTFKYKILMNRKKLLRPKYLNLYANYTAGKHS